MLLAIGSFGFLQLRTKLKRFKSQLTCGMWPISEIFLYLRTTRPALSEPRPSKQCNRVVLPQPLGPRSEYLVGKNRRSTKYFVWKDEDDSQKCEKWIHIPTHKDIFNSSNRANDTLSTCGKKAPKRKKGEKKKWEPFSAFVAVHILWIQLPLTDSSTINSDFNLNSMAKSYLLHTFVEA
jgi:hypothetical protein